VFLPSAADIGCGLFAPRDWQEEIVRDPLKFTQEHLQVAHPAGHPFSMDFSPEERHTILEA
jgi:hypothetical protein